MTLLRPLRVFLKENPINIILPPAAHHLIHQTTINGTFFISVATGRIRLRLAQASKGPQHTSVIIVITRIVRV